MTEDVHGTLTINSFIDITDPCYDEDVWCRINRFPMSPGEYECYTETLDNDETWGWGDRVSKIGIRKKNVMVLNHERCGVIGVDAGMAGFFTCDNKKMYEDVVLSDLDHLKDVYIGDGYFCSSSGFGDGSYDVYAGFADGEVVDLYIEFINGDELND